MKVRHGSKTRPPFAMDFLFSETLNRPKRRHVFQPLGNKVCALRGRPSIIWGGVRGAKRKKNSFEGSLRKKKIGSEGRRKKKIGSRKSAPRPPQMINGQPLKVYRPLKIHFLSIFEFVMENCIALTRMFNL